MPRTSSGTFGTVSQLGRLIRFALVVDGLLATGRRWEDIEEEVRISRYKPRKQQAPSMAVVRKMFRLELAPGVDPGPKKLLAYPAALALQYREIRPMVLTPLIDLLFGLDLSKASQLERKSRFSDSEIKRAIKQGRAADADLMRGLNQLAPHYRRGRPDQRFLRPLWALYETLLTARQDLVSVLFEADLRGYTRRLQTIEVEVQALTKQQHIDALALLYGLCLEAVEISDEHRFRVARAAVLGWSPNLYKLPECHRVAPLIELAVERACARISPRRFNRFKALDQVRPASWREPGPFHDMNDLLHRSSTIEDSLEFFKLRDLNIHTMSRLIEKRATRWLDARAHAAGGKRRRVEERPQVPFPFHGTAASSVKSFYESMVERLADIEGWNEGRFWVMQRGTRCAIAGVGVARFPVMLVQFDFLSGDPVTDRPIRAMPWMLAKYLWVDPKKDRESAAKAVASFLKGRGPS